MKEATTAFSNDQVKASADQKVQHCQHSNDPKTYSMMLLGFSLLYTQSAKYLNGSNSWINQPNAIKKTYSMWLIFNQIYDYFLTNKKTPLLFGVQTLESW